MFGLDFKHKTNRHQYYYKHQKQKQRRINVLEVSTKLIDTFNKKDWIEINKYQTSFFILYNKIERIIVIQSSIMTGSLGTNKSQKPSEAEVQ